jgi:hypothetical protein
MASFRLMAPAQGAIASPHSGAARQLAPVTPLASSAAAVSEPRLTVSTGRASRAQPLRAAVAGAPSSPSSNSAKLPWQAAMSEIKKRKDLKTIMIIGAGPIVIGQVRRGPSDAPRRARPHGL